MTESFWETKLAMWPGREEAEAQERRQKDRKTEKAKEKLPCVQGSFRAAFLFLQLIYHILEVLRLYPCLFGKAVVLKSADAGC